MVPAQDTGGAGSHPRPPEGALPCPRRDSGLGERGGNEVLAVSPQRVAFVTGAPHPQPPPLSGGSSRPAERGLLRPHRTWAACQMAELDAPGRSESQGARVEKPRLRLPLHPIWTAAPHPGLEPAARPGPRAGSAGGALLPHLGQQAGCGSVTRGARGSCSGRRVGLFRTFCTLGQVAGQPRLKAGTVTSYGAGRGGRHEAAVLPRAGRAAGLPVRLPRPSRPAAWERRGDGRASADQGGLPASPEASRAGPPLRGRRAERTPGPGTFSAASGCRASGSGGAGP